MFVQVKLLNGFAKPLLYAVPQSWSQKDYVGSFVKVPIQKRTEMAVVIDQLVNKPEHATYVIKELESLAKFPKDPYYKQFIKQLAWYYQIEATFFYRRLAKFLQERNTKPSDSINLQEEHPATQTVILTKEQQTISDFLSDKIEKKVYAPTLIHGVTGSGKTEIYKQAIIQTVLQNKTVLLLLPEVSLAIEFENKLRVQLPDDITIIGFHSATSPKIKRLLWQSLLEKEPLLIIGVHLPILLPIANLGCIIIDEEHETGYQEKKHPKVNTKEAALMRAKLANCPIVLGSATPALSSLYNVKTKNWHFFQLKKRFSGMFPEIKIVFLNVNRERRQFWITQELENAIKDRLAKKEQVILFLNRRGYSFFVQCGQCSYIFECHSCSVSLTLHENNTLNCHYCSQARQLPSQCPECKVLSSEFLKKGVGTQQLVTIVQKLFPQTIIARADLDTTLKKKQWQQTIIDFKDKKIDILIGTQTITKGYHFPGVTLVGILWADLNLHFPIYNAAETTLAQLIQVAGRAGRESNKSTVIVQTMSNHEIFSYINEKQYLQFYQHEMQKRQVIHYPPFWRLAEIELKHSNPTLLEKEARQITKLLFAHKSTHNLSISILGPAKPPVHKIKKIHTRKIYLKGNTIVELISLYQTINKANHKSAIFFTPNPTN